MCRSLCLVSCVYYMWRHRGAILKVSLHWAVNWKYTERCSKYQLNCQTRRNRSKPNRFDAERISAKISGTVIYINCHRLTTLIPTTWLQSCVLPALLPPTPYLQCKALITRRQSKTHLWMPSYFIINATLG